MTPPADPRPAPQPADVLRWCAAAAPDPWFPSEHATQHGLSRDSLDDPLWLLRQTGLVRVADWVKGKGQGFVLTPEGQDALGDPAPVAAPPPPPLKPPRRGDPAGMTHFDRGERARAAMLDPAVGGVTPLLMVLNAAWFLMGAVVAWRLGVSGSDYLRGTGAGTIDVLMKTGAAFGPDLLAGQWWRLVSCTFVHIGLIHLLANMMVLGTAGPVTERCWGGWRFAVIYLVSGLAGSCAGMASQPFGVLAGASGSVWGVMTALLAWFLRYRHHLPPELVTAWLRRLIFVLVANAAVSVIPGVSWEAHFGGGVAGFLLGLALDHARAGNRWRRTAAWVGVLAVTAAGPVGLRWAMGRSPDWHGARMAAAMRGRVEALAGRPPAGPNLDAIADDVRALAAAGPEELAAAHAATTTALIAGGPLARQDAHDTVDRVAVAVSAAKERFPDGGVRAYLDAAGAFVDALGEWLRSDRTPKAEDWQHLRSLRQAADAAWRQVVGGT